MSKGVNQTLYRNELQVIKGNKKIISMPRKPRKDNRLVVGAMGMFSFNFLSEVTVSDQNDKLIWGISEEEIYNFDTALRCIHADYRQLFTDKTLGAIGNETHVEFELLLANGNRTKEIYEIIAHKLDYKVTNNPVFINGSSTLLQKTGTD